MEKNTMVEISTLIKKTFLLLPGWTPSGLGRFSQAVYRISRFKFGGSGEVLDFKEAPPSTGNSKVFWLHSRRRSFWMEENELDGKNSELGRKKFELCRDASNSELSIRRRRLRRHLRSVSTSARTSWISWSKKILTTFWPVLQKIWLRPVG